MSIESAFAPAEVEYTNKVNCETWGHLFPENGYYEGTIRIAVGIYGDCIILDEAIDIEGSPWWKQEIMDFVHSFLQDKGDEGHVYEIDISVNVSENEDSKCDIHINELRHKKIVNAW